MIEVKEYIKIKTIVIAGAFILSSFSIVSLALEINETNVANSTIKIDRMDYHGVEFSVSIGDFSSYIIKENGKTYDRLFVDNCGYTAEYGKAELPTLSYYVAVPQGAEVSLSYETSDEVIFQDFNVYPSQPPKPETSGYIDPSFIRSDDFYSYDEFYPSKIVDISPILIVRGCRMVMVTVYPFTYNPVNEELRFFNDISINLDFIGGTNEFIPERLRSIYFQPFYDAFLINANLVERAEINNPQVNREDSSSDRADLLVVVYDDFYNEIMPLAEWRHKTGIETKVVKWSDIGSTAEDLRNYMVDAYNNWELPPSFLLIVGDADHVPVNYLYTHPYHGTATGTDHWYVAIEGEDYLPELHTGRISVDDENELSTVVEKILDYCKAPYMGKNWFDDILLAACEESGRFFVWTSETIYDYLSPLGYNCNRQYEGGTPPGSTQGVIDAIDNGIIIANHRDHGASENDGYGYTGWSYPQFTTNDILNNIDNGEMYPIMFSLNCESGWFDGETDSNSGNYESIGEVGIRVADKGFVSVIAATRVSYSGYNDEFCRGFYDGMFPDFDPDYPNVNSTNPYDSSVFMMSQVMNYGKFWMYDKYVVPGGCDPYPWTPDDTTSRIEFEMFHVHGDPTMEVWTAFPQDLTVDHPVMVNYGANSVEVYVECNGDPVDRAMVCLHQENDAYGKGITDSSGEAQIEIEIESSDDVTIIVTAHNCLYYESTMQVGSSYPPDAPTVDGTVAGKPGKEYEYTAVTTDPEEDQILYKFDWEDETSTDWLGPYNSGQEITLSHAWTSAGNYSVKVRAKDINDSIGPWSDPYQVQIVLPELEIGSIKGGFLKITSTIENPGIAEADDINWKISLDGGFILLGKVSQDTIDTIPAGGEHNITSKQIIGFGPTRVTMRVDIPEGTTQRSQGGFIYLFYITVNPGGS